MSIIRAIARAALLFAVAVALLPVSLPVLAVMLWRERKRLAEPGPGHPDRDVVLTLDERHADRLYGQDRRQQP